MTYKVIGKLFPTSGPAGREFLNQFAREKIARRRTEIKEGLGTEEAEAKGLPQDFVSKLLGLQAAKPEVYKDYHIFMMAISNLIAGSDTTGTTLSAILYYLLRYPETLAKLRKEIQEFENSGKIGKTRVTYRESQKMPYLQAVIKEAQRMHPVAGLPLWRVVPEGGAEVSGRFFPADSVLGINAWAAHYNEDIFHDAKVFRPERWIEAEEQGPDAVRRLEGYYFPVCIIIECSAKSDRL